MRVKHKAYFINNNVLASRNVANMKTFGFVPNERVGISFTLNYSFLSLHLYSLNALNRLKFRGFVVERREL